MFEVNKVYSDNINKKDVKTITVIEPVATFKGVVSSYEGYKAMNPNKNYIVFLNKTPVDNVYTINGVTQGKLASDGSVEIYSEEDDSDYKMIKKFTEEATIKFNE